MTILNISLFVATTSDSISSSSESESSASSGMNNWFKNVHVVATVSISLEPTSGPSSSLESESSSQSFESESFVSSLESESSGSDSEPASSGKNHLIVSKKDNLFF